MEEKTRVIVVMEEKQTLEELCWNYGGKDRRDCGNEIEVYLMHKGCSNGEL